MHLIFPQEVNSMFGVDEVAEAKIFFGSTEEMKIQVEERKSPYDGKVVSISSVCNAEDTIRALKIAQNAAKETKKTPLSQRILWLEDVAEKLKEHREAFAMMLTKEVAKPITFSRIEVDRCIETVKLTAMELAHLHGETIPTDIMSSGKQTLAFFRREPFPVQCVDDPYFGFLVSAAHIDAFLLSAASVNRDHHEGLLCGPDRSRLIESIASDMQICISCLLDPFEG